SSRPYPWPASWRASAAASPGRALAFRKSSALGDMLVAKAVRSRVWSNLTTAWLMAVKSSLVPGVGPGVIAETAPVRAQRNNAVNKVFMRGQIVDRENGKTFWRKHNITLAFQWALPPHPGPLPWGEGELSVDIPRNEA